MRFAFIAAKKAEHRVTILCRWMRVTRSGFYAWTRRGLSARAQRDVLLRTKLRAFHAASGGSIWHMILNGGSVFRHHRSTYKSVPRLLRPKVRDEAIPKAARNSTKGRSMPLNLISWNIGGRVDHKALNATGLDRIVLPSFCRMREPYANWGRDYGNILAPLWLIEAGSDHGQA